MRLQIDYLADHPDFIPALGQWHHREWASLRPGDTVEARADRLRGSCGHREIPTVVVAFAADKLLGSAMLVKQDMETRLELSPWLAGVFVVPDERRRGIGAALVRRIMVEASALAVRQLYLYTPDAEGFYARLGWSRLERTVYRGSRVTVMSHTCAAAPTGDSAAGR